MFADRLAQRLKSSEGWSKDIYLDTTGHLTIGYGYNLGRLILPKGVSFRDVSIIPVNSITRTIGETLLAGHILDMAGELRQRFAWFSGLDPIRQEVIADLAYNMGVPKIASFQVFVGQMARGEYRAAAANMRSWRWYRQVHATRAEPLCRVMESGEL